ncbi:MAG: glutathione S-transferase [Betaproteobacteria bacterium]|nr:glutathione S-transferase [Betaproteobacteria bacterium]
MQLLSATPSPYARKVRITLAEKSIPFTLLTEVPWNHDASAPRYNPLEKIPVLILDDGSTVYESRFILEWLEIKFPEPALFPKDPDALLAARQLEVLADAICDAFVLASFERRRPEGKRSQPWLDRQLRKINGGLREVARLVPHSGYCVGGRFGLADIAVGSMLGFLALRGPEINWPGEYPHLASLYARLMERPSFASTTPVAQDIEKSVV